MFNEQLNHQLSMFDSLHLATLCCLVIMTVLLFIFRNRFKSPKYERIFRISLGSFLLFMELSNHLWIISKQEYSLDMLPFTGFCAMTNMLTILALLFNKTKFFNYLIYYAITGSLLSLIFVDTEYGIPHFRYFHYFFVHYGFLVASLFYLFTNTLTINYRNMIKAAVVVFGYSLIILIFDVLLHKNWFYLLENPLKDISDGLGSPWYTILWIFTIIVATHLWYVLLRGFKRLVLDKQTKEEV